MRLFTLSVFALSLGLSAAAQEYINIEQDGSTLASYDASMVSELRFLSGDDAAETLARYQVAKIEINTAGGAPITSKEDYIDCTVAVDSPYDEWDFEAEAGIRGRGNSSWLWYDKKPYRIKLKKKASIMGMPEGKSWVLLANYRDPTHLMNTYVFVLGKMLGLPYTNDTRYAEVTLNGDYIGLYQVTEQVQQGKGRVNVDEAAGYLIQLDADDGPYYSPEATDNFWSSVYEMPVCVKNPDEPTAEQLKQVKNDLRDLEYAIMGGDYDDIKAELDVQSMIDFLIIQELVYNVELDAPRSMYMHRDIDGDLWHMGPLWDFDAGYDFDWGQMYTGHHYFDSYKELVLGTKPTRHEGTIYWVPEFFSDLFYIRAFVEDYQARWTQIRSLVNAAWQETLRYVDYDAMQRNADRWPIDHSYSTEITKMGNWLKNRANYLDTVIAGY
ncbi:MAG: CotH kinase family protein [Bacteroidales bacterium]|nr:CotH kinase family protein [Bacteroidales bacterium]